MNKQTLIGICIGLAVNAIGIAISGLILGQSTNLLETIKIASAQGFLSKLISLGAILNLLAFFYFIKRRKDLKAKGVLIATIAIALFSVYLKFIQ